MPGSAPRVAALFWALLIALTPAAAASARPTGSSDGPADVALAIGLTTAAAVLTGLWLRSRYRRETEAEADGAARPADGGGR